MSQPDAPMVPPVLTRPPWEGDDALEHLINHMQTACTLELYTIPLYLFAAYSIKNDKEDAKAKIIEVAKQEMLHLALAGNILCSIGGQPKLCELGYTPVYPQPIFFEKIPMSLRPATENLKTFVQLEAPKGAPPPVSGAFLQGYHAISEFYDSCLEGLNAVYEKKQDEMFKPETFDKQFGPDDWDFDGGMKTIRNIEDARSSLGLIVKQGEGGPDIPESHYQTFQDLLKKVSSIDCFPVTHNPDISNIQDQNIQKVMIASDAAYSYLLLTIQSVWTYNGTNRKGLIQNISKLMSRVVEPLARFLVSQQLAGSNEHAGPPFKLHQFPSTAEALTNFIAVAHAASTAFTGNQQLNAVYETVTKLFDLKETVPQS